MPKILVVDDKPIMRDSVASTLMRAGFEVVAARDGQNALSILQKHADTAGIISDLKMPGMTGLELLQQLRENQCTLPVVLMTAYGTVDSAVQAMKFGAYDFVQKPFEGDELIHTIRRALEAGPTAGSIAAASAPSRAADGQPVELDVSQVLVGQSEAMEKLIAQLRQIAASHATVLIHGESGTGKEVVARVIHALSPRSENPMLAVNCAALSSSLLESELFGHEKGAFTGADQMRKGRFELADTGTLFLDEVSEIESTLQAKLLRVLQERQFERVGSSTTRDVDVRVLASTNRDLAQSVAAGEFRQDLYYRLNVVPVALPTLRSRIGDVPLLAEHFLKRLAARERIEPKVFDSGALALLQQYGWPGNVRELQNICERACVLSAGSVIRAETIEPWLQVDAESASAAPAIVRENRLAAVPAPAPAPPAGDLDPVRPLEEVERCQIVQALEHFQGNRTRTAEALGIGVRTLGLKLKKWKEQNLVAATL